MARLQGRKGRWVIRFRIAQTVKGRYRDREYHEIASCNPVRSCYSYEMKGIMSVRKENKVSTLVFSERKGTRDNEGKVCKSK